MTVSSTQPWVQYECNGSLTDFDFSFSIEETADITVILTDSDDNETILTETTDYSVSATNDDYSSGGTVSTVLTYSSGYKITILRSSTLTQESQFEEGMATLFKSFEDAVDKLTRISQEINVAFDKIPYLPRSALDSINLMLPIPSAGLALGWNNSEDGIVNLSDVGSLATGTLGENLLDDQTQAEALITLGLTATKEEINAACDGITAIASEINTACDGITATAAKINAKANSEAFVNNANGNPNISDTEFDVDASVTEDSFESVGPTGSGADNIWTALDSVPAAADWIEVRIIHWGESGAVSSGLYSIVYARKNGSSETVGNDNTISLIADRSDGSGNAFARSVVTTKIPVSSVKFDIRYYSTFTTDQIVLVLVGYGYNP